jgi:hydrogenase maturation protease
VIGLGNILLRDDGVGVRVAELTSRRREHRPRALPPRSRVVDGGTLGLDLLPMIEDARALVLIDAVELGRQPGEIAVLDGSALQTTLTNPVSPHQVGVADLLAVARLSGALPAQVVLVGIQPGEIAVGLGLTDAVRAALPRATEIVHTAAWRLHRALQRERGSGVAATPRAGTVAERALPDRAPAETAPAETAAAQTAAAETAAGG